MVLRYAIRSLLKQPAFTFVAVVTLALGIGADTAIFTVADATLRRALPYPDAGRLVYLSQTRHEGDWTDIQVTYPDFEDWHDQARSLAAVAAHQEVGVTVRTAEGTDLARAASVSADFFKVLAVAPALGRGFQPGDTVPGAPKVAILTYDGWQRRFGGDPGVVGKTLALDEPYTVVGVLPRGFAYAMLPDDIFLPMNPEGEQRTRRNLHWLPVIARLAPGATLETAQAEMAAIAGRIAAEHREAAGTGAHVSRLEERIVGKVRPIVLVLLVAVGLLLLVACANVANLLLARASARRKELAIRAALGASRGRLVAEMTTESVLVALAGGACGLVLALWGIDLLIAIIPPAQLATLPWLVGLHVDPAALGFALALSLATGIAVGVIPALQASTPAMNEFLKEDGRASAGRTRARGRDLIVVGQVAVAFVLLAGAGLIGRSLLGVLAVDAGFDPARTLTVRFALPERVKLDADQIALHDRLLSSVAALPGVRGAATVSVLPLTGGSNTIRYVVEGRPDLGRAADYEANIRVVSRGYFDVMNVPLVAGRRFDARDRLDAPAVALINQALAARIFAGANPIGQRLRRTFKEGVPPMEIVGIVGDEKIAALDAATPPAIYVPFEQGPAGWTALVMRTERDAAALVTPTRRGIAAVDPEIAIFDVETIEGRVARSQWLFVRRFPAILVTAFAGLALALAVVGLYGVLSYSVGQRRHEIGIRRAVGAQRGDIVKLVLGRAVGLVLLGTGVGALAASLLTGLLENLLFGVGAHDVPTLAGAAAVLAAVALLASWAPVRRALKVDPMEALR